MVTQAQRLPDVASLRRLSVDTTGFALFTFQLGELSNNGASPWFTVMGLGTPFQDLKFMIDTGTLNTWITSSTCTTQACQAHDSFNASESLTWRVLDPEPRTVDFGPWGNMEIITGRDICLLRFILNDRTAKIPLNEPIKIMLAVNYDGEQFEELAWDGGLAIPAVPDVEATSLLELMANQGLIEYELAAFYFDPISRSGECTIGAVNFDRFDPSTLNPLPLIPITDPGLEYLWAVNLDQFLCDDEVAASDVQFVLDTGSSVFKGGEGIIDTLLAAVTNDGSLPTTVTNEADLAQYPLVTLVLGGKPYRLTPQQYFIQLKPNLWELGITYLEGMPDQMLLVGSVFLDTVYSIFDFKQKGVALAEPVTLQQVRDVDFGLVGVWKNDFGSLLTITEVDDNGLFKGTYQSSTGATGTYPVVGATDPNPVGSSRAVSFSVTWHSLTGDPDPSWHWTSAFSGLLQEGNAGPTITTTYLLQQNVTPSTADYMATAVYAATFVRIS